MLILITMSIVILFVVFATIFFEVKSKMNVTKQLKRIADLLEKILDKEEK